MARVDFYVLTQSGPRSRHTFACRLAEKAYRLENSVHIHTVSEADADMIDELLWTFRDGSFVPHERVGSELPEPLPPVTIGFGDRHLGPRDLLINLCDDIPAFAESFPRVAELVTSDDDCKRESRKRFAAYRDNGHILETHNV